MKNLLRGMLAVLLLALGTTARAEVTLNLKDADIATLIQTVSEVTGRNFIVDPRVKGKVTVISASPMDEDGLYETFLAVLQVQGFAAIPSGDTIKIVPETNARQDGGSYNSSGSGLPIDEVVTHVYPIQNVSAAQLVPILRPLVPQWGHLAAYAASNHAVLGFMRTVGAETAAQGITATCICPGPVKTLMNEKRMEYDAARLGRKFEDHEKVQTPIGGRLMPDDISPMAVYLASDDARMVTGQAYNVCGGLVMS